MRLIIKRIRWKNLLGTGDEWTEILLNNFKTTLISGNNGCGKSTLLDALTFGLFGDAFRNINIPQLINDTNGRDLLVEVEFQVGRKNYKIRRGLKPRIFEIFENNKLVDQDARAKDYQKHLEQNILKLNKKSFTQVVVLGSASFVPFMQLPAADRRFIIEDLLDIQIFSAMNVVLKQRVSEMKDQYISFSNQIEIQNEKVELVQSYLRKIKSDNVEAINDKKRVVSEQQSLKDSFNTKIELINSEIYELVQTIKDEETIKGQINKLESSDDKLKINKSKIKKEILFYQTNNECPTCKQSIDQEFKTEIIVLRTKQIGEIETSLSKLETDLKNAEDRLDEISDICDNIKEKESQITKLKNSIQAINQFIKNINNEIKDLESRAGDVGDKHQKQLIHLQNELKEMTKQRDALTERKHYLDIIAVMLKDSGIKTKIIRQYLPLVNKYVNKYLAAMDFFANFSLDENFKEVIHIHGNKERSYYQLSEGQKLRIDLAILFTWREIAKLKNNANTNLLILDEILESALDLTGVDDFLKLIQTLSKEVNIFIISPKGDPLADKFSNIVKFVENKGFSVMEEIN